MMWEAVVSNSPACIRVFKDKAMMSLQKALDML